jgi:hypothetical protein
MAVDLDAMTTRVAERLQLIGEGAALSSEDRVTIRRAIQDAYDMARDELRFAWDISDVPAHSVTGLSFMASAIAAGPVQAQNADSEEAKFETGLEILRRNNRIRPDNSQVVAAEYY